MPDSPMDPAQLEFGSYERAAGLADMLWNELFECGLDPERLSTDAVQMAVAIRNFAWARLSKIVPHEIIEAIGNAVPGAVDQPLGHVDNALSE